MREREREGRREEHQNLHVPLFRVAAAAGSQHAIQPVEGMLGNAREHIASGHCTIIRHTYVASKRYREDQPHKSALLFRDV